MPRQQMFNAIDQARKRRKPAFALKKFIAKVAQAENHGGPAKPGVIKLPGFSVESRQAQMDELEQRNHNFVEKLRKNPYSEIVRPEDEEKTKKRKIEDERENTMKQLGLPYIAPLEEEEEKEDEQPLMKENNGLYRVAQADSNRALEEFKKTLAGAPKTVMSPKKIAKVVKKFTKGSPALKQNVKKRLTALELTEVLAKKDAEAAEKVEGALVA